MAFGVLDKDPGYFLSHLSDYPSLGGVPSVLIPFAVLCIIHELGHIVAARKEKLEITPFVPFLHPLIGYLGSITPLKSFPSTKQAFFDFAAAGPLVGSLASYAMLMLGLWLSGQASVMASLASDSLPHIPLSVLKESVFVSQLVNWFIPGAFAVVDPDTEVLVCHPLVAAGMLGVVLNAFNLIPQGNLDGARMLETLGGRKLASLVSNITFWALLITG